MDYIPPFNGDLGNPDRPWIDEDVGLGVEGSIPGGNAFSHPQMEILAVIDAAGLARDSGDLTQLLQSINILGGASLPVGAVISAPTTTAPSGFLKLNGAALSRATYADLWIFAQASSNLVTDVDWTANEDWGAFSQGDGATTFRIPDLRGYFLRGLDDGRGLDGGRGIGSSQSDAFKSHTHNLGIQDRGSGGSSALISGPGSGVTTAVGGTETRPLNIAWPYFIKF